MKWLEWLSPFTAPPPPAAARVRFVLHGYGEEQLRNAFASAPDSELFAGVLEQCDLTLMETVNELVNHSEQLTDGQLRQRVGQLRGLTELREALEARAEQARKDAKKEDAT